MDTYYLNFNKQVCMLDLDEDAPSVWETEQVNESGFIDIHQFVGDGTNTGASEGYGIKSVTIKLDKNRIEDQI